MEHTPAQTKAYALGDYCVEHEAEFPYHSAAIIAYLDDHLGFQAIADGYGTEEELRTFEERVAAVQLYCENQGDKFHPHSDELLKLCKA